MTNEIIENIAKNIFEMSEEIIYEVIEKFNNNQSIDKTLTYVYIKAFYIHSVRLYLNSKNKLEDFEEIYSEYKRNLIDYYKINNSQITTELINDIVEAFDKSFEITESLEFSDINDGYEFRHHIIMSFEILRSILEKKSKSKIRVDIFENYISKFRYKAEEIIEYVENSLKE